MTLDIQMILILTVFDAVVDYLILKAMGFRGFSLCVSILVNLLVPTVGFWLVVWSGTPFPETVPVFADYVTNYMFNFVNFIVSSIFGLLVSGLISAITGGLSRRN